jgi:DNA polymerase kappa
VNKPDGQFSIAPNRMDILNFLDPLPIRKIGGIGKVTEKLLLGMYNIRNAIFLYVMIMDMYQGP